MDQFVSMAASKLGIEKSVVESALSVLLGLVKDRVAGGDFQGLMDKLPGAAALMEKGEETASPSGGGLLGAAASALGALGGGSALGAMAKLHATGIEADQATSLVSMFKDYASEQAGPDLASKLLDSIGS